MSSETRWNYEADSLCLNTNRQYCFQLFKQQSKLLLCRAIVNTIMNFLYSSAKTLFSVRSSVLINGVFEQEINNLLYSVLAFSISELLCLLNFASLNYFSCNFIYIRCTKCIQ